MKKLLVSTILAASTLAPTIVHGEENAASISSQSLSFPFNVLSDKEVILRKGATTSYQQVTTLPIGKEYMVIDQFINANGEKWYRVDLGSVKGWGLAESFSATVENEQPAGQDIVGKTLAILDNHTPVRKGATTSYDIVQTLPSGYKATIIDSFTNSSGEVWYRVDLGTLKGWVISTAFQTTSTETELPEDQETNDFANQTPTQDVVGQTLIIGTNNTPVRKGATSSYDIVKTLASGQQVKIIDTFKNAASETWYRVDLGSVKGWVISTSFKQDTPTTNPSDGSSNLPGGGNTQGPNDLTQVLGKTVYSNSLTVPVRKGATPTYATVATLKLNEQVKVIDTFTHTTGEVWYRIELSSGIKGWVVATSVQETPSINKTFYVNVDHAIARSGPSSQLEEVTSFRKGSAVKAIQSQHDESQQLWYQIVNQFGETAWINSADVTETAIPMNVTKIVGTRQATLYKGATFQYAVVEKLPYNSKVTVLQEFVNNENQTWVRIKSASGKTGWVPSWEIYDSLKDYDYLFALNNATLRKGASTSYAKIATVSKGSSLIRLWQHGNWVNVEDLKGNRGWIQLSETSKTSITKLLVPTFEVQNGDNYLIWNKPFNFNLKYTTLSNNRLQLSGNLTQIDVPDMSIPGIERIEVNNADPVNQTVTLQFQPGYTFTIRNHENTVSIKVHQVGLVGKKIIIDAGHGGSDPGAIGYSGLREKVVTLDTAMLIKQELENAGATVLLTRSSDMYLQLSERTEIANLSDYDAFISVHTDSFSTTSRGTTTFYNRSLNFNSTKSIQLAAIVQKHLIQNLGTYNRGTKEQEFYVNKYNGLPSILVELAFISNPREEGLLKTQEFRQKAATSIRQGLEEYFSAF
ncbi:SH3 domain-containing protein [Fredinandcohnia humi]